MTYEEQLKELIEDLRMTTLEDWKTNNQDEYDRGWKKGILYILGEIKIISSQFSPLTTGGGK